MRKPSLKDVLRETVVLSAFLASAGHIYSVAVSMGNHPGIAGVHAIGVDGLVYIGIGAFREGARVRGGLAVTYGGVVSLAFNYAAYNGGTLPAWVIAASMPIVLVLAVLVSMSSGDPKDVPQDKPVSRKRVPAGVPVSQPTASRVPAVTAVPSRHGGLNYVKDTAGVPDIEEDAKPDVPLVIEGEPAPLASEDERRAKAFRMLDEGRDKKDVAGTVGCSVRTLNRWIEKR